MPTRSAFRKPLPRTPAALAGFAAVLLEHGKPGAQAARGLGQRGGQPAQPAAHNQHVGLALRLTWHQGEFYCIRRVP